jgi:iron complex outermembrane receptor protein
VQSGFAKGLSVLFQANNVGNEPYREYDASNGRDVKFDEYGKSYLLGVSYKF